jgi:hypothetical protein
LRTNAACFRADSCIREPLPRELSVQGGGGLIADFLESVNVAMTDFSCVATRIT